jgi:hypothetical protein
METPESLGLKNPDQLILGMQTLAAAYRLPSEFIEALQPENPS